MQDPEQDILVGLLRLRKLSEETFRYVLEYIHSGIFKNTYTGMFQNKILYETDC